MDIFSKLTEVILDGQHRWSKKVLLVALIFCSVVFADRLFKFSDNFITSKKLEQVEKIEKLLESDKIDSLTRVRLKSIETDVLNRETAWDYLDRLKSSIVSLISSKSATPAGTNTINNIKNPNIERSVFWHTLTSTWMIGFIMLVVLIAPFFQNNKIDGYFILGIAIGELFFAGVGLLFSTVLALIPVFENPLINYCLNFIISGGICIGFLMWMSKVQNK